MGRKIIFLIVLAFFSCSTGHSNKYGIYVPNHPHYKLKNKKTDEIPKELDTSNLYKYYGYYNEKGILTKETFDENNWNIYEKFNSNGRAYSFGSRNLIETDLDPNYGSKGYYVFDKKNNVIKYEVFTNGNGGQYVILKYILNKTGDTLTSLDLNKKYHVYIKEKIPKHWKRYKSEW